MKGLPPLLLCASLALLLAPTRSRAQDMTDLELGDEVHYPWTLSGLGGGFSSGSVGDQESRVLTIPVSIWLRRLSEGRKVGLRLRLTGVIGYQDFERLEVSERVGFHDPGRD